MSFCQNFTKVGQISHQIGAKTVEKTEIWLGANCLRHFEISCFLANFGSFLPQTDRKMPRSLGHLQFLSSRAIAEASQDTKKNRSKIFEEVTLEYLKHSVLSTYILGWLFLPRARITAISKSLFRPASLSVHPCVYTSVCHVHMSVTKN